MDAFGFPLDDHDGNVAMTQCVDAQAFGATRHIGPTFRCGALPGSLFCGSFMFFFEITEGKS